MAIVIPSWFNHLPVNPSSNGHSETDAIDVEHATLGYIKVFSENSPVVP